MKHNAFTIVGLVQGIIYILVGMLIAVGVVSGGKGDKALIWLEVSVIYLILGILLVRRSMVSVWIMAALVVIYIGAPLILFIQSPNDNSVMSQNAIALNLFSLFVVVVNGLGFVVGIRQYRNIGKIV